MERKVLVIYYSDTGNTEKNPYGAHVGNRTYVLFHGDQVLLMNKFDNNSREGFIIFRDKPLVAEYNTSLNNVDGKTDF